MDNRLVAAIEYPPTVEEPPFIPPGIDLDDDVYTVSSPTDDSSDNTSPTENWQRHHQHPPYYPDHGPSHLYTIRPYRYRSSRGSWKHATTPTRDEVQDMLDDPDAREPSSVRIVTWNVDFQSAHAKQRLTAALRHIEEKVLECRGNAGAPPEPTVICLQEVHKDALPVLLHDTWVKKHFLLTPISTSKWPEGAWYGNVTLVSKDLTVVRCEIMHFSPSEMQRTALATYVMLSEPEPSGISAVVCVVNTHLESLPPGSPARNKQLGLCSRFLKQSEVRGGVVVGDMNAICPEDIELEKTCDLRDAVKGPEAKMSPDQHTWGYHGQNMSPEGKKYPCGRLDKVFYLPTRGYRIDPVERIGMGLKLTDKPGEPWVSDHFGLVTTLRLTRRRNSA